MDELELHGERVEVGRDGEREVVTVVAGLRLGDGERAAELIKELEGLREELLSVLMAVLCEEIEKIRSRGAQKIPIRVKK
jgi:hypothetical protein